VVRNHVNKQAHPALSKRASELDERRHAARLRVDLRVVNDVVAVRAAGPGLQNGRGVAVGDAEVAEVLDERAGLLEGEVAVELKPVGRDRDACLHKLSRLPPA
jgi:hypothetical protein